MPSRVPTGRRKPPQPDFHFTMEWMQAIRDTTREYNFESYGAAMQFRTALYTARRKYKELWIVEIGYDTPFPPDYWHVQLPRGTSKLTLTKSPHWPISIVAGDGNLQPAPPAPTFNYVQEAARCQMLIDGAAATLRRITPSQRAIAEQLAVELNLVDVRKRKGETTKETEAPAADAPNIDL